MPLLLGGNDLIESEHFLASGKRWVKLPLLTPDRWKRWDDRADGTKGSSHSAPCLCSNRRQMCPGEDIGKSGGRSRPPTIRARDLPGQKWHFCDKGHRPPPRRRRPPTGREEEEEEGSAGDFCSGAEIWE